MITLNPGDFYFGNCGSTIKTILGSCVAITMWHPKKQQGGMCHFLLPSHAGDQKQAFNGKYADHALALFIQELHRTQTSPVDYQVKVFGGGRMFPHVEAAHQTGIGELNIAAAKDLLKRYGFKIHSEHTGDLGHRNVMLDLSNGETFIKWQPINQAAAFSSF